MLRFHSAFLIFLTHLCLIKCSEKEGPTPVVMWHGMGDTCCLPFSLGAIKKLIERNIEGVYVKSIKIGNYVEDYESGFFIHPNRQVSDVCKQLAEDVRLKNGYNAIGFSQGAQFLRAVAQRCPNPPMKNLVSVGGQHQGVFGLPKCPSLSTKMCEYIRELLNFAAYESWVQNGLVQATYWHDPLNETEYKEKSTFLSDINNELKINDVYRTNLLRLSLFVLVKFTDDSIVQPKDSEWFEFYAPGQDKKILPLEQSEQYTLDKIGIRTLKETGRLVRLESPGDHLRMSEEWFLQNILPYLRDTFDEEENQI